MYFLILTFLTMLFTTTLCHHTHGHAHTPTHAYTHTHIHTTGASHDQIPGLPPAMDLSKTTFGRKVVKEGSAAAAVSPCKTREEVEKEAEEGKDLYRKVRYTYTCTYTVDVHLHVHVYSLISLLSLIYMYM